jgi:hypothetical protein
LTPGVGRARLEGIGPDDPPILRGASQMLLGPSELG